MCLPWLHFARCILSNNPSDYIIPQLNLCAQPKQGQIHGSAPTISKFTNKRENETIQKITTIVFCCIFDIITLINYQLNRLMANTFHISLPEHIDAFVTNRVKDRNFKSKGSYIQDLIRQDQLRTEKVKLSNMLLQGLASKHTQMNKDKWQKLKDKTVAEISIKAGL
jgi:Arc/MetJ-type ribon-helix-helix transcriptional regulator